MLETGREAEINLVDRVCSTATLTLARHTYIINSIVVIIQILTRTLNLFNTRGYFCLVLCEKRQDCKLFFYARQPSSVMNLIRLDQASQQNWSSYITLVSNSSPFISLSTLYMYLCTQSRFKARDFWSVMQPAILKLNHSLYSATPMSSQLSTNAQVDRRFASTTI